MSGPSSTRHGQTWPAHLRDSVLQTLALIQRQAGTSRRRWPRATRRQERELRAWLLRAAEVTDQSLKAALTRPAAEIEDERGIGVELVCVGDVDLDELTPHWFGAA